MADTLTRDRLRSLAELRPGGRVLSVFLNLDPSEFATTAAKETAISSIISRAKELAEAEPNLDHEERAALREDVEKVRGVLETDDLADDGTRTVVVYASGLADILEVLRLPHLIDSQVIVDDSPFIEPLIEEEVSDRWWVLLANQRTARIFAGTTDSLEEIDFVGGSGHDQASGSQSRGQHSAEQATVGHIKTVADELFLLHKRRGVDHLILAGSDELRTTLAETLHPYLQERIAGHLTIDVEDSSVEDVRLSMAEVVEAFQRERERAVLDRLQQGVGTGTRATAGLDETLNALNEARVEILLLADDFHPPGFRDTSSGLITSEDRSGPVDQSALEPVKDVAEVASEKALEQDAQIMVIRYHDDVKEHGGIAAILRY